MNTDYRSLITTEEYCGDTFLLAQTRDFNKKKQLAEVQVHWYFLSLKWENPEPINVVRDATGSWCISMLKQYWFTPAVVLDLLKPALTFAALIATQLNHEDEQ